MRVIAVAALVLGASLASSMDVSPIEKVIQLLDDLKSEAEADGANEANAYETFACWCKENSDTLSGHIKDVERYINDGSATLGKDTASKEDKETEVKQRKAKVQELNAELQATIAECNEEKTKYEVTHADLQKALSSLNSAIASMEGAKPSAAALLSLKTDVGNSLQLADALNLIARPKQQAVTAFLQQQVNPDDPEYKYHSQGIVDILNKLLDDFQAENAEVEAEWQKTKDGCEKTQAALNDEITENNNAIDSLKSGIDELTTTIAATRKLLISDQKDLEYDKLFMTDLTKRCEVRAQDWDQRTQMRGKEVHALSQALEILKNQVESATEVNVRAMLVQQKKQAPLADGPRAGALWPETQHAPEGATHVDTDKESTSKMETGKKPLSFLQRSQGMSLQVRQDKALSIIQKASQKIGSPVLTQLAVKAAADPFLKVKELIQKLVERLIRQATEEATKKGFCDTELAKAEQERKYRWTEVQKLNVELEQHEVKRDELSQEMVELREAIDGQTETLKQATQMRKEEKEENEATLDKAKKGLKALNEAILILKSFYKQAAKALLLQVSPIDADTGGAATPGFEGASKGNQSGSKAILGLLEVIRSDFERTVRTTEAAEKRAHADFVEMDRELRSDTAGKETKEELDKQDHTTTLASIESKTADMQTNMDLVDNANAELEELKPVCIDTGMSYEERVEKREQEIQALHNALCILDTDNVESDCTQ